MALPTTSHIEMSAYRKLTIVHDDKKSGGAGRMLEIEHREGAVRKSGTEGAETSTSTK
jgi:hypothetical protein